jgi:hypothetical protein
MVIKMKYDKDALKKNLTIEEIYELMADLGAEPIIKNDYIVCKTICHNHDLAEASHKLYYYSNTQLFHCYTGCGDATFDIYDLILKVNKLAGNANFSLSRAITFVARYFGYTPETFEFEEDTEVNKDWQIIKAYKRKKEEEQNQTVELKVFDAKILQHFPQPHIIPWEKEGISFDVMRKRGICYDPINEGIIIPHYDIDGKLIGIRERTLVKENEVYGKYRPAILNGTMYNHPLSFALYNLNNSKKAISHIQKAIVFEG